MNYPMRVIHWVFRMPAELLCILIVLPLIITALTFMIWRTEQILDAQAQSCRDKGGVMIDSHSHGRVCVKMEVLE